MRSGTIDDLESSCLVLAVALPAGTLINFSLRTDSAGFDILAFFAGSQVLIPSFGAPDGMALRVRDWEQQVQVLPDSVNSLSWCYSKSTINKAGDDAGWVDALSFFLKDDVCAALDLSTADCALITGVSTTLPSGVTLPQGGCCRPVATDIPWFVSTVRTEGANSLRSGDVDHSEASCLVLAVSLPAATLVRFSLRTSSQGQHDRLAFFVNNQTEILNFSAADGSVTKDWEQQNFAATSNVSNLTWCYLKNAADDAGDDSGWLDDLSFLLPLTKADVCSALDLDPNDCNLITGVSTTLPTGVTLPQEGAFATVATDVPWLVSTVKTEGASSLRSGEVSDTQGSCLVLEIISGTRQLRFSLRTSSEGRYDRLAFFAGNQTVIENFSAAEGSVTREWEQRAFVVTNDVSHLSWCYLKNGGTFTDGDDRGWLDNLLFVPRSDICEQLDLSDEECALIISTDYEPPEAAWLTTNFPTPIEGRNALQTRSIGDAEQSCLILNVLLPDRALVQFFRRVSSQPADELYFSVDNVRQEYSLRSTATTVLRDWSREVHILFDSAGDRELRWCYVRDASGSAGSNRAWLDNLSVVAPPAAPLNRELVCLVLNMSIEDCELITTAASEPAAPAWYISNLNSEGDTNNGETSLRSAPEVTHNQTSCLVLGVTLPDSRMIRFFLRSDSEAVNDFVYFAADGIRLVENFSAASGSDLRAFEEVNALLPGNVRTLKWCYTKNGSTDAGADSAWLDRVSFSAVDDPAAVALTQTLVCQALDMSADNCALIDSVAADPAGMPWVLSSTATEGGLALRSGDIDDDETSCLVLGISLPAERNLRFSLRTDSEAVNDLLYFEADGTRLLDTFTSVAPDSSVRDWEPLDFLIADSVSSLKWCYTKNGSTSTGEDSGWLDALTFTTPSPATEQICLALDMSTADCALITGVSSLPPPDLMLAQPPADAPWLVASELSHQGGSALRSGFINHSEASCLVLEVMLPTGTLIRFSLLADSEPVNDHLTFAADTLTVIENFSLPAGTNSTPTDFEQQEYTALFSIDKLSWCYQKNASGVGFDDRIWLDTLSFTAPVPLSTTQLCTALDLSADNCSQIQSLSFDPPSLPWQITTDTSVAGGSSMRSGDIGDGEQSCLVLEVSLPANSVISVAARIISIGIDRLHIQGNNLQLDTLSAFSATSAPESPIERDWRQQSYFLPTAISTLSWCYEQDFSDRSEEAAWIDNLSFSAADISYQSRICAALDVTENNCSMIESIRYEPPELLWVITAQTSVAGGTSLRSGAIGDGQQSCIALGLTLPAGSVISVAGRSSSEGGFDRLQIDADKLRLDTISAEEERTERGFRLESYFLPTAISTLRWCYTKNDSQSRGQDAAWIDNLSFSTSNISYQDRICAALDVTAGDCKVIESVSYEPPELLWIITAQTSVAGGTSLRSGDIGNGEQSCLVLELTLPVNSVISVAGRTSSEGGFDQLQIDADKLRLDTISAPVMQTERDWRQESYFLPTAISTLSWCYAKDDVVNTEQDAAWIDNLSFSTSNISYQSRICAALDVTENNCSLIQSVSYEPPELLWIITSQTSVAGRTSLRSGDVGTDQQSCIVLGVSLPADYVVSVAARTSSEGDFDQLLIDADNLNLDTISAAQTQIERDWRYAGYTLSAAISTLSWCYDKDGSSTLGQDAAWIDALAFISSATASVCEPLDLSAGFCGIIESVTYEPPQNRWQTSTSTESLVGASALVTPPLDADQSACLSFELTGALPADSHLIFSWRITSPSEQDMLQFQAGSQQRQLSNEPEWQTEYIGLDSLVTTLSWCYTSADEDSRAWLDGVVLVTPADRYRVEITVVDEPVLISTQTDTFRYSVEIRVESPLLPPPTDWVLLVSGIENIVEADSTFALSFGSSGSTEVVGSSVSTEVVVVSTSEDPLLRSTVLLALIDRPSFSGASGTSVSYSLTTRAVAALQITVPSTATQTAADAPIEIAVEVRSADRFDRPFDPEGLMLNVENLDNLNVPQSSYVLSFDGGVAQTTITVELITGGVAGRVEVAVISGEVNATASVFIDPTPPELASITLSAASSSLVQTMANTPVAAELILAALDNYGNPIGGDEVIVQLSASLDAIVESTLTVAIETSGTTRQLVEVLPQNDLDTTLTVQLSRGTLDEAVELLPEGGIQITVRALRVLRQLQLSLVDEQSPLQQIDPSLPIRANIRLAGLDQYDQPIAFSSTTLTATTEPTETTATLSPQQLSTTDPEGAVTVLEVVFPDTDPENTMITIAIASPSTGVTTQDLIIQALPDTRNALKPLNVDAATDVTGLDLIIALRWLADQESSTQSLVVNLAITSTGVMTAGIDNLQELFNEPENMDRVDLNKDGRADQLDLRILLRYMSGLRGSELADQEVFEDLVRLLLGR